MESTIQNGCINEEDQPIKIENIKSNNNDFGLLQKRIKIEENRSEIKEELNVIDNAEFSGTVNVNQSKFLEPINFVNSNMISNSYTRTHTDKKRIKIEENRSEIKEELNVIDNAEFSGTVNVNQSKFLEPINFVNSNMISNSYTRTHTDKKRIKIEENRSEIKEELNVIDNAEFSGTVNVNQSKFLEPLHFVNSNMTSNSYTRTHTDKKQIKIEENRSEIKEELNVIDNAEFSGTVNVNQSKFLEPINFVNSNMISNSYTRTHTDKKRYVCDNCDKAFSRKDTLIIHLRKYTGEKPFKCNRCGKRFSDRSNLISHERTHTGEKPYVCPSCHKSFSQNSTKATHLRKRVCEKKYRCKTCKKGFFLESTLTTHLTTHLKTHIRKKDYICKICNKQYISMSNLRRHEKIHTAVKLYKCDSCISVFFYKSYLTSHLLIHSGEKQYQCKVCSKKFSTKSNLKKHSRLHIGKKLYSCQICYKAFSEKPNLMRHLRIHTYEKKHKCDTCSMHFNNNRTLIKHIRTSHEGFKLFKCDICANTYIRETNLKIHVMRLHF